MRSACHGATNDAHPTFLEMAEHCAAATPARKQSAPALGREFSIGPTFLTFFWPISSSTAFRSVAGLPPPALSPRSASVNCFGSRLTVAVICSISTRGALGRPPPLP